MRLVFIFPVLIVFFSYSAFTVEEEYREKQNIDVEFFKGHDSMLREAEGKQRTMTQNLLSTMTVFLPSFFSKLKDFQRGLLNNGEVEGRGPKDLIAIVSTMLASLLGAILVKLNVLIVLSIISIAIGKLLLFILTVKSKIFTGGETHQSPVVYEKVFYPHHHPHHRDDNLLQLPQTNLEESFIYSS